MFELKAIHQRFGSTRALEGLSLQVQAGQTLALIGPSGCGKSTLIRVMMGLVVPESGEVWFAGQPLSVDSPALRRRMGYVVQGGGLFPHLTAAQNATLMARHLEWEPARIDTRLEELVDLTRFPREALARYPSQLSGGQAQRVSLMRGLMLDPDVVLLDEPLGALDPMTRAELQHDLRQVFDRLGKTVVLVTHDLAEATYFGHQIALLREGRLVQLGTLAEFIQAPAEPFVTQFLNAQRGWEART